MDLGIKSGEPKDMSIGIDCPITHPLAFRLMQVCEEVGIDEDYRTPWHMNSYPCQGFGFYQGRALGEEIVRTERALYIDRNKSCKCTKDQQYSHELETRHPANPMDEHIEREDGIDRNQWD